MPEPGLGEILSVANQSGNPTGQEGVVFDNRQILQTLNENARFKAENDWKKYNTFLTNLKDVYSDLGTIQGMEVASQDREVLKKQAGDIFQDIADNPRAFFGGQKMGEIQAKIANLRGLSSESKQNSIFDFAHRQYLSQNPELNTEENKKLIEQYWKNPLGKRSPYILNLPTQFDYQAYAKDIAGLPSVSNKFAQSGLVGQDPNQPGNEFIRMTEGTRIGREPFLKAWMAGLNTQKDKYGHSIRTAIEQQYNQLPDQLKKQFGGSVENYFKALGESAFNSDKDIVSLTKDELKPNQFRMLEQKQRNQVALEAVKQGNRKDIEILKHNLSGMPTPQQTEFLLNLNGDILKNTTGDKLTVDLGKGKFSTEEVIDASVPVKQLFGKKIKTTTKEGLTTESASVTTPDVLTRLSDGSVRTIFYKKDATGNTEYEVDGKDKEAVKKLAKEEGITPDEYKQKYGKPLTESTEVVSPKEQMSILGKEFMDKKSLPGAVEQADLILKQYGGNILNYTNKQEKEANKKKFDKSKMKSVSKAGKTYYVDPETRTVYDEDGDEVE